MFHLDISEWDILETSEAPPIQDIKTNPQHVSLGVSLRHEMWRHLTKVRDAIVDVNKRHPLNEKDWGECFDGMGRLVLQNEFRIRVFHSGVEPSLRREVWPHLLGVYPSDLSTEERTRFLLMKGQVYNHLKEKWVCRYTESDRKVSTVEHMVQRDVLRTDRTHRFFNVDEHHPNLVSLFNILTTYATANPDVSYCQGMSDLAAPILVVVQDEALSYLCFCRVMSRLKSNFVLKGSALLKKFMQLGALLHKADEQFYKYLMEIDAGNLYFCYRMLLLELKREFPFDDALRVMETIWSSLPPDRDDESDEIEFYHSLQQSFVPQNNGRMSPMTTCRSPMNERKRLSPTLTDTPDYTLPHPRHLNDGTPFPLFLCLSVLLASRDHIMNNNMDYSMLAIYFDKMSRKHDAAKILVLSKTLYLQYLRMYLEGRTVGEPDGQDNKMGGEGRNIGGGKVIGELEERNVGSHGTGSTAAQC